LNLIKKLILLAIASSSLLLISFVSSAETIAVSKKNNIKNIQSNLEENKAAQQLSKTLSSTLTYRATFKQSVFQEDSDRPEVTTGEFLIQRPNHFSWKTRQPFEQSIIADGANLWTYDPELEQATLQNQQSVLADSPLLLLTSSVDSLMDAFRVTEIENKDNNKQQLYALYPKKNSLFENVHLLIEANKIKEIFLVDTLGSRTSVVFDNIKINESINVNEFIFVPPKGIDIIDSRESN